MLINFTFYSCSGSAKTLQVWYRLIAETIHQRLLSCKVCYISFHFFTAQRSTNEVNHSLCDAGAYSCVISEILWSTAICHVTWCYVMVEMFDSMACALLSVTVDWCWCIGVCLVRSANLTDGLYIFFIFFYGQYSRRDIIESNRPIFTKISGLADSWKG